MKTLNYIPVVILSVLLFGCGLDNYDEPSSQLTGKIIYNGETIGVRHASVIFDLYQDSYELSNTIEVFVDQDGTFSSMLFDGDYRMVARDNNGPWLNGSQPVEFSVKGNTQIEYKVTPYYTFSNVSIVRTGNNIAGACTLNKVDGSREVEEITLYVGKTRFVDDRDYNKLVSANQIPVAGVNNLTVNISEIEAKYPVLYARLGVRISGVSQRIFSEIVQIK